MINKNEKTTILLTSITLLAVAMIMVPTTIHAETPIGCDIDSGTIGGSITVLPSGKISVLDNVQVTYRVSNTNVTAAPGCDAELSDTTLPVIEVQGIVISPSASCPRDTSVLPLTLSDGEEVELWGPSGIFGECEVSGNLTGGIFNEIDGKSTWDQFNVPFSNFTTPQSDVSTTTKIVYSADVEVTKVGPAKVKLVDGQAEVDYSITVLHNGTGGFATPIDTCILEDSLTGIIDENFTLSPGFPEVYNYTAIINGTTINTATITCEDQKDYVITDTDDHTVQTYESKITVQKMAPAKLLPSDLVNYEVWISNNGTSNIDSCVITDDALQYTNSTACGVIAPGGSCHVTIPGPMCSEAPDTNTVNVTCKDQLGLDVTNSSNTLDRPLCADFKVGIEKICDEKVVQLPGNPDSIDCKVKVENLAFGTITGCVVSDSLNGNLTDFSSTFAPGQMEMFNTTTTVTQQMIDDMTVTNTATVTCDTQDTFPPVTNSSSADILVRSVDGTVEKTCTPDTQNAPGNIQWEWWADNTSSDGKSSLDVECSGISTVFGADDPMDDFSGVINATDSEHNIWSTTGLDPGMYDNAIECTFTAQNDVSFTRTATASCDVENVGDNGCTPGYWKQNAKNWNATAWTVQNPDDILNTFISNHHQDAGDDLLDALQYKGGKGLEGAERNLLRHAVAAKLNIENGAVAYPIASVGELKTLVENAIDDAYDADDRSIMNTLKDTLDENNNLGCTIDADGDPIDPEDS